MNQSKESLAEQLKGFSAVHQTADAAARVLNEVLQRYGPVSNCSFDSFRDALDYLLPLKSFTTRFLVLGLDAWSLLVTDMRGENCGVDAYAISRATGCNAIGVVLQQERRELHVYERSQEVREVQSLSDGDRWYYREEGLLQPFEEPIECLRRRKKDRLSVDALHRYFERYTGLRVPDWKSAKFTSLFGLERSLKDMRVPLSLFETINDV